MNGNVVDAGMMSGAVPESLCLDSGSSTTRTLFAFADAPRSASAAVVEGGLRCRGYRKQALPGKPLLTIATVVYNGVAHLGDTINSVMALPYDNVEFIIVDGGSRDGTLDLIRQHEDHIDYWVSAPDAGIYDAMNKAWSLAAADASVLFLGSGDMLLSLPAAFDNDSIYFGDVRIGDSLFVSSLKHGLRYGNHVHHQALMVPRRLHPAPPFDLAFKVYADFDFNQRLLRQGQRFVRAEGLVGYALPGGISAQLDVVQMAAVTRKNFGALHAFVMLAYFYSKRLMLSVFR